MNNMNEKLLRLEASKTLDENIDKYLEALIDYYGEDKREEIKDKFKNATYIGYINPNNLRSLLIDIENTASNEITDNNILKDNTISLTKEDIYGKGSYIFTDYTPIKKYIEFKELYDLGRDGRKERYIETLTNKYKEYLPTITKEEVQEMLNTRKVLEKYKYISSLFEEEISVDQDKVVNYIYKKAYDSCEDLLKKVSANITLDTYTPIDSNIKELDNIATKYIKGLNKYNEFVRNKLEKYIRKNNEYIDKRGKIQEKYDNLKLFKGVDFLNKEDLQQVKENIKNPNFKIPYSIKEVLLTYDAIIDSFSTDGDNVLKEDTKFYSQKSIIESNRVKYFNYMGINLGLDYKNYLSSAEVQKIWPSKEKVDNYIKEKDKIQTISDKEFYTSLPEYKEMIEKIGNDRLIDMKDIYETTFINGSNCIIPNVIKKDSNYESAPIVLINFYTEPGELDHNIYHELNHVYELNLESVTEKDVNFISGWDNIKKSLNDMDKDYPREYELLNEVTNEKIAQEIETKAHQNNKYILDSKETSKVEHLSSYEQANFLLNNFYTKYKDDIIKSRSSGNINHILNVVGRDNFEDLNDLFKIYEDNLSGMNIYHMYDSLRRGEDNNLTRTYHNLINKRNNIIKSMNEYNSKEIENIK